MAKPSPTLKLPKSLTQKATLSPDVSEAAMAFINAGGQIASDPEVKKQRTQEEANQIKGFSLPLTVGQLDEIKDILGSINVGKPANRKKMSIRDYLLEAVSEKVARDRKRHLK